MRQLFVAFRRDNGRPGHQHQRCRQRPEDTQQPVRTSRSASSRGSPSSKPISPRWRWSTALRLPPTPSSNARGAVRADNHSRVSRRARTRPPHAPQSLRHDGELRGTHPARFCGSRTRSRRMCALHQRVGALDVFPSPDGSRCAKHSGTDGLQTLRWRGMESNFLFRAREGAVSRLRPS